MGTIENKKVKNALENLLDRQNYLVTQANELARAFGNLKATEHKILDYCFSYIKKEDTVDAVYHLTLQEILKHLGLNASGRNYTRVAIALQKLHEKTALYLQLYDEDGTPFIRMTSLFQHIDIKSNGTVEIKYNADIAPYIFQLKEQYYSFNLIELSRVRSKYTLIMLKLWNSTVMEKWPNYSDPHRKIPDLYLNASLEEWESWFLGYTIDKEKKKHPVRWPAGRFKQKVLDVALKELADLYPKSTITLTPDKRGRRVVGYTLEIRQINTTLNTNTVVIDGKPQPPRVKGKQGVRKKEKSIPTNVSEKVAEYNVEKQVELSEVEKLKQELARLEQEKADLEAKVNSKPKEVKGLFDDDDLKKSEKKINDNLDKMTRKSPQDWEQTDLF
ncbi:RepB family plasmid replication initiator protein [Lactobacillus salivarius]|uniref:replication initiation protein n=2 Tax=Ligilactobacillus salivarius TaxID=1624 RepID=UPI0015C5B0F0|nr:replication initiation protein [Ligilactobacillus salivarius]NXZ96052.1 RepB family plasmid replication initiator protein [Ligilactobacillus salivarius]NYA58599.1 RepB family plasmid replication initiator protein [Ligilactobacillus salivarius]NYA60510.1 RepB family plasmid replication initiator protein [Ligilactobacillus salivarius]NYA65789.1 RepB family plasmid replication initiator protein [Ligilactobacillus salivarius]NYA67778.1 RepB family plasmid replication initiator protein [Ligilact